MAQTRGPGVDDNPYRALPKVELHRHLEGSIAAETLLTLADRNGLKLPWSTPEAVRAACRFADFDAFVALFLAHVRCLRKAEDFAEVVYRLGGDLAADSIRYAEITWTPQFYIGPGRPPDALLAALNDGRRRAGETWGVEMAWIPDLVRSVPGPRDTVAGWAASRAARAGGVVALGLGGPEAGHPAAPFAAAFRKARAAGLAANPHAGEGAGPDSIRSAVDDLGARRIGHGVRAVEDAALMDDLAARGIVLEVCPTSNLRIGYYPDYAAHPLKRLVEAGCRVTLNTDDPALFDTTLSDEYRHAVDDCGLNPGQLRRAAFAAVDAAYLPDDRKAALRDAMTAAWDAAMPGVAP